MSLSLLANYGSSSESESDNEEISIPKKEENLNNIIKNDKKDSPLTSVTSKSKLSSIIPPPKKSVNSIFSNADSNSKKHSLFSQLPQPKKRKENKIVDKKKYISLIEPIEDDDDDEETAQLKREIEEERRRKLNKNSSINNLNDEKSDNENAQAKQGLFSLLPAPQNSNKKNEEKGNKTNTTFGMVPLSLKRKEEKKKLKEKEKIKSKNDELKKVEEEEEKVTDDFFSLDTPTNNNESDSKDLKTNNSQENDKNLQVTTNPEIENSKETSNDNYNYEYDYNQQNYDANQYQYPQNAEAYGNYDYNNYYNQYYYQDAGTSDPNFNNNILKLQEMGEFQMGEIKEINQKDQISNVYEVERTKQVSMSNQPSLNFRGISKDFKPSFKQKSKHNIMYLAYQAKAKETELLEANLQRKANRKISSRKYGF